jgi:hypothetical protein
LYVEVSTVTNVDVLLIVIVHTVATGEVTTIYEVEVTSEVEVTVSVVVFTVAETVEA